MASIPLRSPRLADLIPALVRDLDLDYVVFEHTPHLARDHTYIRAGYHWIDRLVKNGH